MIICSWYSGIGNFNYYPKFFFFFEFWMFEKCTKRIDKHSQFDCQMI